MFQLRRIGQFTQLFYDSASYLANRKAEMDNDQREAELDAAGDQRWLQHNLTPEQPK